MNPSQLLRKQMENIFLQKIMDLDKLAEHLNSYDSNPFPKRNTEYGLNPPKYKTGNIEITTLTQANGDEIVTYTGLWFWYNKDNDWNLIDEWFDVEYL